MIPEKFKEYNPKLFAKGKRGLIYTFKKNKKTYALKIKNPESEAFNRIQNEAKFLKIVNKYEIGPKLTEFGEGYVCYEFIDGITLKEFLKNNKLNKRLIKDIEKQCKILDKLKINKKEMHFPVKNILIKKNKAILIDFERCSYTIRPKNLNQFKQFLNRFKFSP